MFFTRLVNVCRIQDSCVKAESYCSENDNANDAKRTQSIGWIAPCRIRPRWFNQLRACIFNILIFVFVIEACVTGPLRSQNACLNCIVWLLLGNWSHWCKLIEDALYCKLLIAYQKHHVILDNSLDFILRNSLYITCWADC